MNVSMTKKQANNTLPTSLFAIDIWFDWKSATDSKLMRKNWRVQTFWSKRRRKKLGGNQGGGDNKVEARAPKKMKSLEHTSRVI